MSREFDRRPSGEQKGADARRGEGWDNRCWQLSSEVDDGAVDCGGGGGLFAQRSVCGTPKECHKPNPLTLLHNIYIFLTVLQSTTYTVYPNEIVPRCGLPLS